MPPWRVMVSGGLSLLTSCCKHMGVDLSFGFRGGILGMHIYRGILNCQPQSFCCTGTWSGLRLSAYLLSPFLVCPPGLGPVLRTATCAEPGFIGCDGPTLAISACNFG